MGRIATMNGLAIRPRPLLLICGAAAVGTGMAYMAAAGAPFRYLLVNLAALALGTTAWLALGRPAGSRLAGAGAVVLGLAAALLLTAFFGHAVEGASRWVSVGPLNLQVSLIVLPVMLVLYARRPDPVGTVGMMAGAVALAVQPDRAMAGVMTAGLVGLLCASPGRLPFLAAITSIAAFGWTLLTPDALPAVPFVDGILYTAFEVHPLAGLAVVGGAVAVGLPSLALAPGASDARPALLAFGGCWSAAVLAAALGNYPTPLVGYGGSAILGYFLSGAVLPTGTPAARRRLATGAPPAKSRGPDGSTSNLRLPNAA